MKYDKALIGASLISILLFLILAIAKEMDAAFVDLSAHWIAIIALPVVSALFFGGYITKFKGFGVELEAKIKGTEVAALDVLAGDAVQDAPGMRKGSVSSLESTPSGQRSSAAWLSFISGKRNYYNANAIAKYLEQLPNATHLQILSEDGGFICELPTYIFTYESLGEETGPGQGRIVPGRISSLIDALEENRVLERFDDHANTTTVSSDRSLIDVLQDLRQRRADSAAVIDPSGKFMGIARSSDIEKRIADLALSTHRANSKKQ